jgi:phosphopantothenoylcysteine decarboxylase / phosphopantothenate---cysteine ligase
MTKKNIILGVTASIAAYKACDLITRLSKKDYDVTCIMTEDAERFVGALTLETLSGNKVYRDMFELPEKREVIHVSLAQKADLIVICPATANIIGKIASGISDDLLTCTVTSSTADVLIAPAMNENMYKNKITEHNIRELKKLGYEFIDPIRGRLACGSQGLGHIADTDDIIKRIEKKLK